MSSIAEIQQATAAHFGLTRGQLLGRSPARRWSWPRQLGMAIARADGHSLQKIARHFGRHHTTVLRATRAVSKRETESASDVAAIKSQLARYQSALRDFASESTAARAVGAFCAALGARSNAGRRSINTGIRGTRGENLGAHSAPSDSEKAGTTPTSRQAPCAPCLRTESCRYSNAAEKAA